MNTPPAQNGSADDMKARLDITQVDVVSFGWTKEASMAYGIDVDVRQLGIIAQKVKSGGGVSPSLVLGGRKNPTYPCPLLRVFS